MSASSPQRPAPDGDSIADALNTAVDPWSGPLGHRDALWRRVEVRRARARQRRGRAAVLGVSLALVVTTVTAFAGSGGGDDEPTEQAVAAAFQRVERQAGGGLPLVVEQAGSILSFEVGPVRAVASASRNPVPDYEAFGSASIGGGVTVTGATQGATPNGDLVLAAVAVAVPEQADMVVVTGPGGARDEVEVTNPVEVLAVTLAAHDPRLQLTVEVYDGAGSALARGTILPFSQIPWVCDTNPEVAVTTTIMDVDDEEAVTRGELWFAAPLPAACP